MKVVLALLSVLAVSLTEAKSAQPRDTFGGGDSAWASDPAWTNDAAWNNAASAPVVSSAPASVPFAFPPAPVQQPGVNAFLATDWVNTGLSIIVGVLAFSLIVQIVNKIVNTPAFEELFSSRNMRSLLTEENLNTASAFLEAAVHKYNKLNVPK